MPTDIKTVESEWQEYAEKVLAITKEESLSPVGMAFKRAFYAAWLSALSVLMPMCAESEANMSQLRWMRRMRELFEEVKAFYDSVGD
jgi:hypothetical protein